MHLDVMVEDVAAERQVRITSHRNLRERRRIRASGAAGPWRLGGDPGSHHGPFGTKGP
jgi:hypothetical protein